MMNMFYRLIILVLPIIGLSLFHISAYAEVVVCNTMVGNNSTDNSKALNECMQAAASKPEKTVNIPAAAGAYKVSSTLTVPEGVSIIGDKGAKLNATFRLSNYSKLINMDFLKRSRAVIIGETSYVTGAEVRGCTFGTSSWASVIAYRVNDCIFDGNSFTNTNAKGQNLIILGGKRNVVKNNTMHGGKTGIIFKYSREANGGGYNSLLEDNLIMNNTVQDFAEEGISFDVVGNDSNQVASLEYDTISSASRSQVTLAHPNWKSFGNPSYVGYDMIFLSGTLAGQLRRITAQSSATFTLDADTTGAANGDEIVIGATFKRNIIRNNTVISKAPGSILFFGMGFYNIIEHNTLTAGSVSIRSLDNVEKANMLAGGGNVTGTWGRAPCGYNLIRNNKVGGRIILYYRVIKMINGHANTYRPYYSYGNVVVDNKISDVLWANYQYFSLSGNTGKTEFYNVTRTTETSPDGILQKIIDADKGADKGISAPKSLRAYRN